MYPSPNYDKTIRGEGRVDVAHIPLTSIDLKTKVVTVMNIIKWDKRFRWCDQPMSKRKLRCGTCYL